MKIHKLYIVLGLLIALGAFFELAAHASETNESTKITFSSPIQISGKVLPAGTYLFQQADPNGDLNMVQIFSPDRSVLYATLQTVSAERTNPTGETAITLAQPESGNPPLLVKWFYAGRVTGHEFVYSKPEEQEIAQGQQETFVGHELVSGAAAVGE
jgi:Protein of unknown function (DUF2911)